MTHLTAVGHVAVQRRVWRRPDGGLDVPADNWLNGQAACISVGARERCCRLGCHPQGFRRSAEDLRRLAGISVSPERLRQIVEGEGRRVAGLRQTGALTPTWRGAECLTAAWRHKVVHLALEQDVGAVLDEVTQQRTALRRPAKRAALARLRNYVGERTSMIRYAENRARGWDIGRGPTESLCKTRARRLKGAGLRWEVAGADAILQFTALQDSNAWENYWKLTAQQN